MVHIIRQRQVMSLALALSLLLIYLPPCRTNANANGTTDEQRRSSTPVPMGTRQRLRISERIGTAILPLCWRKSAHLACLSHNTACFKNLPKILCAWLWLFVRVFGAGSCTRAVAVCGGYAGLRATSVKLLCVITLLCVIIYR